MENLGVILFIVFAVLAALSRAKQGGTGAPRPGTRLPPRPGSRPGSSLQVPDVPMPQAGSRPAAEAERAETLVPEDLWALLTGERRPPPRRTPLQTPHELTLPGGEPGRTTAPSATSTFETVTHRPPEPARAAPEAEAGLAWWPPLPVEAPAPGAPGPRALSPERAASTAAVVTAGTVSMPAAAAAAPAPPPDVAAAAKPAARAAFADPAALRRAFVAQLVFGLPKALE